MVCISCILIPLALYIWHRFLQPVFLKMWNPWAKVEDQVSQINILLWHAISTYQS